MAMGVSDVVEVLSEGGEWRGRPGGGLQPRLLQTALRELAGENPLNAVFINWWVC